MHAIDNGGIVKVNEQNKEIRAAADLLRESFRLTCVNLWQKQVAGRCDKGEFKK